MGYVQVFRLSVGSNDEASASKLDWHTPKSLEKQYSAAALRKEGQTSPKDIGINKLPNR
ncbi:hypothetical protein [Marinobacter gelidimuriae]|uniref:hypothetical protein n=1 Tax=Marinobacter gelidimuriae TaxID=2739064 RepID=UPI0003699112|nr:hypothetical protein [Marinobacter gelidimuriae]